MTMVVAVVSSLALVVVVTVGVIDSKRTETRRRPSSLREEANRVSI